VSHPSSDGYQAMAVGENPMGCSSGSIENAHLIVVPSCGHWSRAGPPPGGPCLERQSRGLSNPQPFPPESFRREQALSLQHHLICGADVFHAKRSGATTSGSRPNALFQEKASRAVAHCAALRAPARIDRVDGCQSPDSDHTIPKRATLRG
jgi:hypothetical protein